jgi:pimeloyl-ACP methyl ester carboxylesterase
MSPAPARVPAGATGKTRLVPTLTTELLEIAYADDGPRDGPPVLLLHGWPDSPRTWREVASRLTGAGHRTIVPALRGFAPTRFRDPDTPRTGQVVALAQDALDLLDGLGLDRAAVVGHDWGARTGYALAALAPERLSRLVTLSVGDAPGGAGTLPSFEQTRLWWYQWFQTLDAGAAAVARDPVGFARVQWDTWSPAGWYEEAEFAATAEAFAEPDFVPTTLHYYRVRWGARSARSRVRPARGEVSAGHRPLGADAADPRRLGHLQRAGADRGAGRLLRRGLPAGGGPRRRPLRAAGGAGHGRRPDPRPAARRVTGWTAR